MVVVDILGNSALKNLRGTTYSGDFGSAEGPVPGHGHLGLDPNPNINRSLKSGAGLLYRGGKRRNKRRTKRGKRSHKRRTKRGKRSHKRHTKRRRSSKGGYHVKMQSNMQANAIVGPKAGHPQFEMGKNCGIQAPHKLGAGMQHGAGASLYSNPIGNTYYSTSMGNTHLLRGSYPEVVPKTHVSDCQGMKAPQNGGARVKRVPSYCNSPMQITSYTQVKPFWNKICPGAVTMYNTHLMPLARKNPKKVLNIVRYYTAVFCHEVKALRKQQKKLVIQHHQKMKKTLNMIRSQLSSLPVSKKQQAKTLHNNIANMHLDTVKSHHDSLSPNASTRKNVKITPSASSSRKTRSKNAGYKQYVGNWAQGFGYQTVQDLAPHESALAGTGLAQAYKAGGYGNKGNFTYDPMRNW